MTGETNSSNDQPEKEKRGLGSVFFLSVLLLLLEVVAGAVLCLEIYLLNMLPLHYLAAVAGVILLMIIIQCGLLAMKQRLAYMIAGIFAVCINLCMVIGCVYVRRTDDTLQSITKDSQTQTELDSIVVVVMADSDAKELKDLADKVIGIQTSLDRENTDKVIAELNDMWGKEGTFQEYEGIYEMVEDLYNGRTQAVIFNDAYHDLICDSFDTFEDDVRLLNTFTYTSTVEVEKDTIRENLQLEQESFILYFSGIDTYGNISAKSRSDVNILAVVNPKSRRILLLTTPRDYYVALPFGEDCMDKLTHAGIYGIECSMETLENLYGINIDYYVRVNFTGFMDIVDALGGVNVYSEYDFTSRVGKYDFTKGINHVNGKQALGFVRERYSFASGDVQRARNQMAMIRAIEEKATSPAILTKYTALLDSIKDAFTTDLTSDDIATLVKMQLEDGTPWQIDTYSVGGKGVRRSTYSMGKTKLYVTLPDEESIAEAGRMIEQVVSGELLETQSESGEWESSALETLTGESSSEVTSSSPAGESSSEVTSSSPAQESTQQSSSAAAGESSREESPREESSETSPFINVE